MEEFSTSPNVTGVCGWLRGPMPWGQPLVHASILYENADINTVHGLANSLLAYWPGFARGLLPVAERCARLHCARGACVVMPHSLVMAPCVWGARVRIVPGLH